MNFQKAIRQIVIGLIIAFIYDRMFNAKKDQHGAAITQTKGTWA